MQISNKRRRELINKIQTQFDVLGDLISNKFRKDIIDYDTWKELYGTCVSARTTTIQLLLEQPN